MVTADSDHPAPFVWLLFILSPITFLLLTVITDAPFGKLYYPRSIWGPSLPPRVAWALFESPNLVWCIWSLIRRRPEVLGKGTSLALNANSILLIAFVAHYVNRSVLYPMRMSRNSKKVPLAVAASGFSFCALNGYIQTSALCIYHPFHPSHHTTPQFIAGMILFLIGMAVNIHSDSILRRLRDKGGAGGGGYQIPRGGLFEYVSCANLSGELLEWTGFALAGWPSHAPLAFAVYSFANLVPRALSQHSWYLEKFEEYPKGRKAVVPFLL